MSPCKPKNKKTDLSDSEKAEVLQHLSEAQQILIQENVGPYKDDSHGAVIVSLENARRIEGKSNWMNTCWERWREEESKDQWREEAVLRKIEKRKQDEIEALTALEKEQMEGPEKLEGPGR